MDNKLLLCCFKNLYRLKTDQPLKKDVTYISPQAPLAQAILLHKVGEEIEYLSPGGPVIVKILKIY